MSRLFLIPIAGLAAIVSATAQQPCQIRNGVRVCQSSPTISFSTQNVYVPEVQHHEYPVQKIIANDANVTQYLVTVPVDSRAIRVDAYNTAFYYSVAETYRDKAMFRAIVREEIQAAIGGNPPQPNAQPPGPYGQRPPANPAGPGPVQQEEADVVDDVTPPDLQQKVLAAYLGRGNCLSCHGGASAQGPKGKPYRLVNDQGQLLKKNSDKRWKNYGMASVGAMPPTAANDASKAMESVHLPVLLQYASIKDR